MQDEHGLAPYESKEKLSRSRVEHGAVNHEEILGTVREGLGVGLEGWRRKGVGLLWVERHASRPYGVASRGVSGLIAPCCTLE